MRTDEILLKWKRQNKYYKKEMKREEMMATFEGLIKGFSNNNEVSKKLSEIIPVTPQIKINWDNTAEINQLYYLVDEEEKGIPIINAHSIVWAVLNGYCMDGEEVDEQEFNKSE